MLDQVRVGVVGLGHRGRGMFKLAADGFDFVVPAAACDLKPENWYESKWLMEGPMSEFFPNTSFYTDYDQMLSEADLDVVIVETGADCHAAFCAKALERNIHVLTDIPVVATLDEADRLWETARRSSAMISVGANPNEQKFCQLLQDYYRQGKLGKPYYLEAEYIHWSMPGSETNIHLNENGDWRRLLCPIRYCTHSLGPLLTVVPDDIRYVSCFGTGRHADNGYTNHFKDDMQSALFRTEDGTTFRILRNGRCRAQLEEHSYRVFGTEGYMERTSHNGKIPNVIRYNSTLDNDDCLHEVNGDFTPEGYENKGELVATHGGMDVAMLDHFFDALRHDKPAPIPLREGLRMTIPGIYAEESAKRGGELLRISYPWDKE